MRRPSFIVPRAAAWLAVITPACVPDPVMLDPVERFSARLHLHNGLEEPVEVRWQRLKPGISIDCEAVARDPGGLLPPAIFERGDDLHLEGNQNIALDPYFSPAPAGFDPAARCEAYRIELPGPPVIAFWREGVLLEQAVETYGAAPPGSNALSMTYTAHGIEVVGMPQLVFPNRTAAFSEVPGCALPEDRNRVAWDEPVPQGAFVVEARWETSDGCTTLQLREETTQVSSRWALCVPESALAVEEGTVLELSGSGVADVLVRSLPTGSSLQAVRGLGALPPALRLSPLPSKCPFYVDEQCGTVARNVDVSVEYGDAPAMTLAGGEEAHFERADDALVSVIVAYAQERIVVDAQCALGSSAAGLDIELVVVETPVD